MYIHIQLAYALEVERAGARETTPGTCKEWTARGGVCVRESECVCKEWTVRGGVYACVRVCVPRVEQLEEALILKKEVTPYSEFI